jgi:hypothetical protein
MYSAVNLAKFALTEAAGYYACGWVAMWNINHHRPDIAIFAMKYLNYLIALDICVSQFPIAQIWYLLSIMN